MLTCEEISSLLVTSDHANFLLVVHQKGHIKKKL
jgi:hypothetical protein